MIERRAAIAVCAALVPWAAALPAEKADPSQPAPSVAAEKAWPICVRVFSIAASVVANKNKGEPESKLRAALPPRQSAPVPPVDERVFLIDTMHAMLDEVYGGATPSIGTYPTYRSERCVREHEGKPVPGDFAVVRAQLDACAKSDSKDRIHCAMRVAGSDPSAD